MLGLLGGARSQARSSWSGCSCGKRRRTSRRSSALIPRLSNHCSQVSSHLKQMKCLKCHLAAAAASGQSTDSLATAILVVRFSVRLSYKHFTKLINCSTQTKIRGFLLQKCRNPRRPSAVGHGASGRRGGHGGGGDRRAAGAAGRLAGLCGGHGQVQPAGEQGLLVKTDASRRKAIAEASCRRTCGNPMRSCNGALDMHPAGVSLQQDPLLSLLCRC